MPNRYEPLVIDEPVTEPVTVAEVKLACRISTSAEDSLLAIYIAAVRDDIESRTRRTIHQKTLEWVLDYWPWLGAYVGQSLPGQPWPGQLAVSPWAGRYVELPRATPLLDIESVTLKDSTGTDTIWDPTEYFPDTDSLPGRLVLGFGQTWPNFTPYPASSIRIRYTAGIGASSLQRASGSIKLATLLLVGGLYENRESEVIPDRNVMNTISLRYGVEAYLARLRVPSQWAEM